MYHHVTSNQSEKKHQNIPGKKRQKQVKKHKVTPQWNADKINSFSINSLPCGSTLLFDRLRKGLQPPHTYHYSDYLNYGHTLCRVTQLTADNVALTFGHFVTPIRATRNNSSLQMNVLLILHFIYFCLMWQQTGLKRMLVVIPSGTDMTERILSTHVKKYHYGTTKKYLNCCVHQLSLFCMAC